MSQTTAPVRRRDRATGWLRQIDGLSHLVLGPPLLIASPWVGPWIGVPTVPLAVFLAVFVAYGVLVTYGTRSGPASHSTWTVAALANVGFAIIVALSVLWSDLTTLGYLAHLATLAGASAVLALSLGQMLRRREQCRWQQR